MLLFFLQDHPRSRGNNLPYWAVVGTVAGSPPLAREQPISPEDMRYGMRITPARAGTTNMREAKKIIREDHPRSRGNNYQNSVGAYADMGSPPLAREQQS